MLSRNEEWSTPSLPLLLVALVVFLQSVFQTGQLVRECVTLDQIKTGQNEAIRNADLERSDLETLVQATLNLARDGDKNVLPVIEQLRQLGIVASQP